MKHGPSKRNRGPIRFAVETKGELVVIKLENPGAFTGPRNGGSGLGIVKKRLALAYGDRASFSIEARPGERTCAMIMVPMRYALVS